MAVGLLGEPFAAYHVVGGVAIASRRDLGTGKVD
jgi:hypothetical protein